MPVGIFPNIVPNFKNIIKHANVVRGGSIHFFPSMLNLFNRKTLGKLWLSLTWEKTIPAVSICWPGRIWFFPRAGWYSCFLCLMSPVCNPDCNFKMLSPGCWDKQPIMLLWWQFWILRGLEDIGWSLWFPARLSRGLWDLVLTVSLSKHLFHNGILTLPSWPWTSKADFREGQKGNNP